jgi:hypothetical protein
MTFAPLNPTDIDAEIIRLSERLETTAETYSAVIEAAAKAEAHYKYRAAVVLLEIIGAAHGRKSTVQEREARVEVAVTEEHESYLLTAATAKAVKESLYAIRTQLDSLRTLAANIRQMT